MRARAIKRPMFDPRYRFVVTPPAGRSTLAVGGRALAAGVAFDKTWVDARRLRQMYDARLISVAPGHEPLPAPPRRPRAIGPARSLEAGATPSRPAEVAERVEPRRTVRKRLRLAG